MSRLVLAAPLAGWAGPLGEAPDPVFAEHMLGEGVLIDPIAGELCAPAAGEILSMHAARHAVAMRCAGGAEILMHVGVDTVTLNGEGFTAHVRAGDRVAAGARLLSFDLDFIAARAKSLATPVILTNGEAFAITRRHEGRLVAVGEPLLEIVAKEGAVADAAASGPVARRTLALPLAHGLHARPAARIAAAAKPFAARIDVIAGARRASAKSPVALLSLALSAREPITLEASGADAEAAVAALADLIASGMGEAAAPAAAPPAAAPLFASPVTLRGVAAAPGLAVGVAVRLDDGATTPRVAGDAAHEQAALAAARAHVRADIAARAGAGVLGEVMSAHLALIDDAELAADADARIAAGAPADAAWREAMVRHIAPLRAARDPRLAQRADDLADLERQVLRALSGADDAKMALPEHAILVADVVLPSQLAALDPTRLAGLCMARGGAGSHVALIAEAMGAPALVGLGDDALRIPDRAPLILDAEAGELRVLAGAAEVAVTQDRIAARAGARAAALARAHEEARTADGVRIAVEANLGAVAEAPLALEHGAEGCGLMRTEFLFLDRGSAPSEDEQARAYQAIADALGPRSLTLRTLDAGADKPAPYLGLAPEDNPALGLRGVRVGLAQPDLLRTQLRAMLRVRPLDHVRIMLPMVIDAGDVRAVRALLDAARAELGVAAPVPLGVMIETPAAALCAETLAAEADFFSIGSNDLAQYALAIDRGAAALAGRLDGLHPAVLRLIALAVEGARKHGRAVSVCGGLAGDPLAVPLLIGLGVITLSAPPRRLPEVKAALRTLTQSACEDLARAALGCADATAVRARVKQFQESNT